MCRLPSGFPPALRALPQLSDTEPLIHMSFGPDKPILTGFLGNFAPYSFSALDDGLYMPAMTHSQQPTSCNAVRTGWFVRDTLSQKREVSFPVSMKPCITGTGDI